MKISPVTGMTTIAPTSNTGLSAEKLARLKAVAAGEVPKEEEVQEKPKFSGQPTIKMKTNRTVNREMPVAEAEAPITEPETPASATSDASEQVSAVEEATQPLNPQLAAIAKQRRALQQERQAFEKEKELLVGNTRADLEAKLKTNALSTLQELGVTYDQLTNEILASQGGIAPEIQALKAEIKALKEGVDKTLSDKDIAAEQAVLKEMRRNVDHLASQGEEFELIRAKRAEPDVIELIHRTWKQNGEILDEAEAMKLIEEELLNESLVLAKLKKVQGKLTPTEPLKLQEEMPVKTGMKTLTNRDSAKPLMDRRQRAIAAALGQLKR